MAVIGWITPMTRTSLVLAVGLMPLFAAAGIKGPPRISNDKWESQRVVREGQSVKLSCPILANPDPLYDWRKDDDEVDDTWSRFQLKRHTLRIKNAQVDDSGRYNCRAVNGFGVEQIDMHLIVLSADEAPEGPLQIQAPRFSEMYPRTGGDPVHLKPGDTITLQCRADGLPRPDIEWFKDGSHRGQSGDLNLREVVVEDSGIYTCRASSPLGQVSFNFTIDVNKPEEMPEISDPVNTTVELGRTTSLQCTVRSSQEPSVQWLKEIPSEEAVIVNSSGSGGPSGTKDPNNPNIIRHDNRFYRKLNAQADTMASHPNEYLSKVTIRAATAKDEGVYVCLAINTKGFASKSAILTVLHPPRELGAPGGAASLTPTQASPEGGSVKWIYFIIPGIFIFIVVVTVVACLLRRSKVPDKPIGVVPPVVGTMQKGDHHGDPSALAPLNPDHRGHLPTPGHHKPDIVYQEAPYDTLGTGQSVHSHQISQASNNTYVYPSAFPTQVYPDPAYSDPYSGDRGGTRSSDHSYARLTTQQQAAANMVPGHSPNPPPPYVQPSSSQNQHQHQHQHRQPQYFVHYNL